MHHCFGGLASHLSRAICCYPILFRIWVRAPPPIFVHAFCILTTTPRLSPTSRKPIPACLIYALSRTLSASRERHSRHLPHDDCSSTDNTQLVCQRTLRQYVLPFFLQSLCKLKHTNNIGNLKQEQQTCPITGVRTMGLGGWWCGGLGEEGRSGERGVSCSDHLIVYEMVLEVDCYYHMRAWGVDWHYHMGLRLFAPMSLAY